MRKGYLMRPKSLGRGLVALLGLLLLLQFNNCGGFQNVDNLGTDVLASLNCGGRLCIEPNASYLALTANLASGTSDKTIGVNLSEFNIAGDCNEGGFPYNTIRWELWLNGAAVRNSTMMGMSPSAAIRMDNRCINGRYFIYVNLAALPEDPRNRTGLLTNGVGSVRSNYQLYIEVIGQDTQYDTNSSRRSRRALVNLIPI